MCAVGQINMVPGQWQPEWVPATVLVYGPPLDGVLTVIFEDEGEPFRHAIDFEGAVGRGGTGVGCVQWLLAFPAGISALVSS